MSELSTTARQIYRKKRGLSVEPITRTCSQCRQEYQSYCPGRRSSLCPVCTITKRQAVMDHARALWRQRKSVKVKP